MLASPISTLPRNSEKLRYFGRSFGDPFAHLIIREDRLQCHALPAHLETMQSLYHSGVMGELEDAGFFARQQLVASDGATSLILEQELPTTHTYCSEWPYSAWKQASLFYIDLLLMLFDRDLALRNPHPWNLDFNGSRFRYLNPGSIVPFTGPTLQKSWEKILQFFIRPLVLACDGNGRMARHLLRDLQDGVPASAVQPQQKFGWKIDVENLYRSLLAIREQCSNLSVPDQPLKWAEYYEERRFQNGSSWNLKREHLERVMRDVMPERVIDLGGNTGFYSKAAANTGIAKQVVCADVDDAYVSRLHEEEQSQPLGIVPLVLDFTNPTPGYGVDNAWFPPATQRMCSDLVLAYALEHHLVFGRYRLDFDQFARGVWSFSSRCALVEFVPPYSNLPAHEWRPECMGWYHAGAFREAFEPYFARCEEISVGPDGRRLFRCDGPVARGVL